MFQTHTFILAIVFMLGAGGQALASSLLAPIPDCSTERPAVIESYVQNEELHRQEVEELRELYLAEASYWQARLLKQKRLHIRTSLFAANCLSAANGLDLLLEHSSTEEL